MNTMATRLPTKFKGTTEALREALEPCRVVLSLPPTANHLRMSVRGRLITSPEYRAWTELAGYELLTQHPKKMLGTVGVSIQVRPPKLKRNRDLDNFACFKGCLDLLVKHGIIEGDDSRYVRYLSASWDDIAIEPGVVITIKPAVL